MEQKERRKHPRIPMLIGVTNWAAGASQYFLSADLSLGGMFLQTREPFDVGTRLELDFQLPNYPLTRIQVSAEVVRAVKPSPEDRGLTPGMGLALIALDDKSRSDLSAFLETVAK